MNEIAIVEDEKQQLSLKMLVMLYNKGLASERTLGTMLQLYHLPYRGALNANFAKNRQALMNYRFWRGGDIPDFPNLPDKVLTDNTGAYYLINEGTGVISSPQVIKRTKDIEHPFFRDLSKPLFIENEFNLRHWEYLFANVRRSEDFGGDNHVYMWYSSWQLFFLLLQVVDIRPFLAGEKFIFLFGQERYTSYPLNFPKEYGIDYNAMTPKPIRINELNRLIVNWMVHGCSGNSFWQGVIDFHPNCLMMKELGLADFGALYERLLAGKTVTEVAEALNKNTDPVVATSIKHIIEPTGGFVGKCPVPTINDLFRHLLNIFPGETRPNKVDWLRGWYLAYNLALGRDLNQRVSPAIVLETHPVGIEIPRGTMYDVYRGFAFFRGISIFRRPTSVVASWSAATAQRKTTVGQSVPAIMGALLDLRSDGAAPAYFGNNQPIFLDKNDEWLPYRRLFRFEDLKLEPRAMLESICDFLDLAWHDSLMKTTVNGVRLLDVGTTSHSDYITDFDTAPVYNRYEKVFSFFDGYRIECLVENLMATYGYKPIYHTDGVTYSAKEIENMFTIHLKIDEKYNLTPEERQQLEQLKKGTFELIRHYLAHSYNRSSDGRQLVPIPWLKPKREYMKGALYE